MRQDAREIEAEAASWVARMDGGVWTAVDEAALQLWLSGHPRRPGALLQAQAAWATLDATGPLLPAAEPVAENTTDRRSLEPDRRLALAIGGSAMAASLMGGFLLLGGGTRYATDIGEIRRVPLDDGSTVAINTASLVAVKFERERRFVDLDRGEAWFHVAHDPTRPFVVAAGPIRVQAVGTAFAVRLSGKTTIVSVTEGVVEVWAMTTGVDSPAGTMSIVAGGHAAFADGRLVDQGRDSAVSIDRALAWREGKIDLVDTPLGEAVAEFNRYNRRRLVVADPAIAGERFDGTFNVDDVEGFALAIRKSLDVPVSLDGGADIRLGTTPTST